MARVVVVGATGRTGRLLIEQLQARGDAAVAVFRNAAHAEAIAALGAEVRIVDLATVDVGGLAETMTGADAVIFAAGTRENEDNVDEIDRDGAIKTAEAARQAGVRRFVQISAMGVRTGIPPGMDEKMQAYYRAKQAGDQYLMKTDLDWTVIEPGELTEDAPTGRIRAEADIGAFGRIARADVAATALAVLDQPGTIHGAFELIGGDIPIAEALRQIS